MVFYLFIAEVCSAQSIDTVIFKTVVKLRDFEYNDTNFSLKVYVRPNGYYSFREDVEESPGGFLIRNKKTIPYKEIFMKSDTMIKKIPNFFPYGLRKDCLGCDFDHAYRLYLFSELPIHQVLEDNIIRISYINNNGYFGDKPSTYHLIKVFFRNDSSIMQYKEGKFVEGDFYCYRNDKILLNKKEVELISKLDRNITWVSESYDCISIEDKDGVVERKNGNYFFSCVRNSYCSNIDKKKLSSMIQFITTIQKIKNDRLKLKMIERFPH